MSSVSADIAAIGDEPISGSTGRVQPHLGGEGERLLADWGQLFGRGVKIGVISSFDLARLAELKSRGEITTVPPVARRFCWAAGAPCKFGSPGAFSGVGALEVMSDEVQNATFYLAELGGSAADYRRAIDWFAANGVRVIHHGYIGALDGPGNGTGPSASIVDYAVSKNMLWVNPAGNVGQAPRSTFRGGYWRGRWNDPDNDRWLNFAGTDETNSIFCGVFAGLRWDDWTASKTDYDIYISDYRIASRTSSPTRRLFSGASQAGASSKPIEGANLRYLCNDNPAYGPVYDTNKDGFVSVSIQRTSRTKETPTNDVLELLAYGGYWEHSSSAGGAGGAFADSKNLGEITVGSSDNARPLTKAEFWSAMGPTNDGRAKPDLVAPGCLDTWSWYERSDPECLERGYWGTSASASVVTSAAAIELSKFPTITPAALHLQLRAAALQPGQILRSNQIGAGNVVTETSDITHWWPPIEYYDGGGRFVPMPPTRWIDSRPGAALRGVTHAGPYPVDTIFTAKLPNLGDSVAAVLSVTVVSPLRAGRVQIFPPRFSAPGATSTLAVAAPGRNSTNLVVTSGNPVAFYLPTGGHVVVDIVGRFARTPLEGSGSGDGRYHGVEPVDVFDSTTCVGMAGCVPGSAPPANVSTIVRVAGIGAVPAAGARAALVSLSAIAPTTTGTATAVASSVAAPNSTTTVSFSPGMPATSSAFVALDANGSFRLTSIGTAHLRATVLGWFTSASGPQTRSGLFYPHLPRRLLDTHVPEGSPPRAAGASIRIAPRLPAAAGTASFLLGNFTTDTAAADGYLTGIRGAAPGGERLATISRAGRVSGGAAAVPMSNIVSWVTPSVDAHVTFDSYGWFQGPTVVKPGQLTSMSKATDVRPTGVITRVRSSVDGRVVAYQASPNSIEIWDRSANVVTSRALPAPGQLEQITGDGDEIVVFLGPTVDVSAWSIVVIDWRTGSQEVVTTLPAPTIESEHEGWVRVSDDGRYVSFVTNTKLLPADTNPALSMYLRDRTANSLTFIGPNRTLSSPAHGWVSGGVSPDGTHAVVMYAVDLTRTNYFVTRRSISSGATKTVSWPGSQFGEGAVHITGLSSDGNLVSYYGRLDTNGSINQLNMTTAARRVLSIRADGFVNGFASGSVSTSRDGRYTVVGLDNWYDLVNPSDAGQRVMVKDSVGGSLLNVFLNDRGELPANNYYAPKIFDISGNGRLVVYAWGDRSLVDGNDPAPGDDIYVWDRTPPPVP